jgi:hypothetical protein
VKALGNSGDAHAGHLGIPHAFVRAGAYTTMAPHLAILNLREEMAEIFRRGAAAKSSES